MAQKKRSKSKRPRGKKLRAKSLRKISTLSVKGFRYPQGPV
jgi:hypothetical protein